MSEALVAVLSGTGYRTGMVVAGFSSAVVGYAALRMLWQRKWLLREGGSPGFPLPEMTDHLEKRELAVR